MEGMEIYSCDGIGEREDTHTGRRMWDYERRPRISCASGGVRFPESGTGKSRKGCQVGAILSGTSLLSTLEMIVLRSEVLVGGNDLHRWYFLLGSSVVEPCSFIG